MYKRKKKKMPLLTAALLVISCAGLLSVLISGTVGYLNREPLVQEAFGGNAREESTTESPVPRKIKTVRLGASGDILIHEPILKAYYRQDGASYDFNGIFKYCGEEIKGCDYFTVNFETTLGGTENGRKYSSYPCFNSPDSIADALKNAGVDCLLTANNHSYDTRDTGVMRTQQVIKEKSFDYIGTRTEETAEKHIVKNIGGIKFGMINYTYETDSSAAGRKALNGILVDEKTGGLINSFNYNRLDEFYREISAELSAMKGEGAEAYIVYLHWGNEYNLKESSHQQAIAQKLCDMGVDVIIGGHPHVVQPVDLLTSTDGNHKTVCVYSTGNMVSNQRRQYMGLKSGHTEDGMIFETVFSKYSDGSVVLEKIKIIPTWVYLHTENGKNVYSVVPLSKNLDGAGISALASSASFAASAKASYERTEALVAEGEKKCNDYLSSVKTPDEIYIENNQPQAA